MSRALALRASRLYQAVYAWFFAPGEHAGVVVARVAFGGALFSHYVRLLPDLAVLFLPSGINGAEFHARYPQVVQIDPHPLAKFDLLAHIQSEGLVIALYVALVLAALSFALGAFTRSAGLCLVALHMIFGGHQPTISWGWAHLIHAFVLYAVIADCGRTFSVDAWWRARRGLAPRPPPPVAGMRLLQLHLCTMYTVAGWERLDAPSWLSGQMVTLAVVNSRYARFELDWQSWEPLLELMNYTAYVLEPLAPIALWIPRLRVVWALLLVGMHFGLELLSYIGYWQWIMVGGLCVFLPDHWFARLGSLARLGSRTEPSPRAAADPP